MASTAMQRRHEEYGVPRLQLVCLLTLQLPVGIVDEHEDSGTTVSALAQHTSHRNDGTWPHHSLHSTALAAFRATGSRGCSSAAEMGRRQGLQALRLPTSRHRLCGCFFRGRHWP